MKLYFNVINSRKKANFMILYYLNDSDDNYTFDLDEGCKIDDDKNPNKDSISFKSNGINVKSFKENDINFYITGALYERNENSNETINNTCFLQERNVSYVNKTFSSYNNTDKKSSNWTLVFNGIPNDQNLTYDLRLQIVASINSDNSKEEYLTFTKKVDLTRMKNDQPKQNENSWLKWGIPVIVVGGVIFIIVLVFFVIKFFRLQKTNTNLRQEMVSMAFSNEIQKNVLTKDMQSSKNESDYESTFI